MKKKKAIMSLLLCFMFLVSALPLHAYEREIAETSTFTVGESTTETIHLGRLDDVDLSDIIPDGVTPIFVETLEELEDVLRLIAEFEDDLRRMQGFTSNNVLLPSDYFYARGERHIHLELAEYTRGTGIGMRIRFNAHVSYGHNPSRIFSVTPYTVMTGFGLGYAWTQEAVGTTPATIPAAGLSEVTAWASGVIEWYVIHPNFITFHRIPVSFAERIGWA